MGFLKGTLPAKTDARAVSFFSVHRTYVQVLSSILLTFGVPPHHPSQLPGFLRLGNYFSRNARASALDPCVFSVSLQAIHTAGPGAYLPRFAIKS